MKFEVLHHPQLRYGQRLTDIKNLKVLKKLENSVKKLLKVFLSFIILYYSHAVRKISPASINIFHVLEFEEVNFPVFRCSTPMTTQQLLW